MAKSSTKGVAWIALVVALVALVLAWVAFNRTGENLDEIVEREVQEAVQEVEDVNVPEPEDVDVEADVEAESENDADTPADASAEDETTNNAN